MENPQIIKHGTRRVLTTQQLAESYETNNQVITNNFNRNKERYVEGKHYLALEGITKSEFIDLTQIDLGSSKNAKVLYLWTEKGALLHAKSLNTDKAWEVYEHLVETYFKAQEVKQLSPMEIMKLQFEALQDIDNRVEYLENTMTIDYEQQEQLNRHARARLIHLLGGKGSPAYKLLSKTVFSSLWNRYKQVFKVSSYKNTSKMDFVQALEYIDKWEPTKKIGFMITGANSQIIFNN